METDDPFSEEARQQVLNHIDSYNCYPVMIGTDDYLPGFIYGIGKETFEGYMQYTLLKRRIFLLRLVKTLINRKCKGTQHRL